MTQACFLAVPWENASNIIKIFLPNVLLNKELPHAKRKKEKKRRRYQNNLGFALK